MNQNSEIVEDFEDLLKKRILKKTPALYASSNHETETLNASKTKLTARELLANVAKQVKAIQNADTASYERVGKKLDKCKKREFLTVDMIPDQNEVPQNIPTKFETQCVTDTQLINVIEDAEIIDVHKGITQEFDKTFRQKSDEDDSNIKLNDGSLKSDETTDNVNGEITNINVDRMEDELNSQDSKLFENSDLVTCEMDTITCCQNDSVINDDDEVRDIISQDTKIFNKCAEIIDDNDESTEDANRTSPVLTTKTRKSISPLVVDLNTFENFEQLAHPIIEEHEDFEMAKNLINSQIVGREIYIPDHVYETIDRESPIFDKIECITTNINKENIKSVCTYSNKYIDEHVKNILDSITEDRCCGETSSFNEPKKMESNTRKIDIKDEILFSSDEEYEYLHKDVQELPLTCALETSFYNTSDVLDKTMYVGFQTASNKSIQILTDSFHKAKSILSSIDNEGTEATLTDLVKIFDSGKAVSKNVQSIQLKNSKENYSDNETSSNVECKDDTNLTPTSENSIQQSKNIDDTFQDIHLTELEQDRDVNDDIVMSQIIEFKSISRATKTHNIRTPAEKISDTFDDVALTALEQNMADDIPMSQIIEFKSISRTPKLIEKVRNESLSDVFLRPAEVAKRKFEGFKTASNKKIKLSDKALARCKKVFQDIDLNDTVDLNYEMNKAPNEVSNLSVPGSDLNLNPSSELNHCAKESENHRPDNIPTLSHLASATIDRQPKNRDKPDLIVQEKKCEMEDVDLQINDQILQEFEDNVMPFEETNNNACVGFRTANNKNIVISDIAMMKSKHLFQDIITIGEGKDYTNINKATGKDDSKMNQNLSTKFTVSTRNVTDKQEVKTTEHNILPHVEKENKEYDNNIPSTSDFHSNKTTTNKEITTSKETKQEEFNCGIDTQDFCGVDLTRIEDCFKHNEMENVNTFQGFQTASKKAIVISERAMENSKKLFEDITNVECDTKFLINDAKTEQKNVTSNFKVDNQKSDSYDNNIIETGVANVGNETNGVKSEKLVNAPKIIGFQTVSAKPIHISAAALARTKGILSEFEIDDEIMVNNDEPLDTKPLTNTFVGFQTASNKQIKISAKALGKSKQLFNDFELEHDCDGAESDDRPLERINNETSKLCLPSTSKLIGFKTASNKELKVSNQSLARSKKIFQEIDDFDKESKMDCEKLKLDAKSNKLKGFQIESNKVVSISEEALKMSRQLLHEAEQQSQNKVPVFRGFQTASNKQVKISKEALAKSKQIFQDVDIFEKESDIVGSKIETKEKPNQFRGFQTGNNKEVIISDEAIKKSKELFRDISTDEYKVKENDTPVFRGFQTASNKAVKISEEALARSKRIFQDVDIFENECEIVSENVKQKTENVFRGFQTARNKKVNISEKALEKSRKLFNDIDDNKGGELVFQGFQTANNKKVKISDDALAKSKQIFQGVDIFEKESETSSDKAQPGESEQINLGFATANNKKVNISDKALEESRKLFDTVDCNILNEEKNESIPVFIGFQTASNKNVNISEKALAKCKQLFEDLNLSQFDRNPNIIVASNSKISKDVSFVDDKEIKQLQTNSKDNLKESEQTKQILKDCKETAIPETKLRNNRNVTLRKSRKNSNIKIIDTKIEDSNFIDKDVIDTQVINDFQDTLNTEDFCKNTPKSKRSGSPILSCPRAKKRKFETPYSSHKKVEAKNVFVPPKLAKTYNFNDKYKKHKKYNLKDLDNLEKVQNMNKTAIDPYIFQFNFDTLLNFEFSDARNNYTKDKIGVEELKRIFLGSVNKKIVPDGWLDNHIRLIIWKLLSYEILYPNVMKNTCTVRNVLEQLKYRYDRELYHVQRPILRKVLEKDEVPSKTMVLCVAAIYVDNISVTSVFPSSQNVELLVTDGWYCVRACTDRMMVRLLARGAVVVGTKIAVSGAELVNCDQGIAPWEDTSSVRLKLSSNSVRPCRRRARLGLRPGPSRAPLRAARADGGRLTTTVLLARVYPMLYVEKMDDGSTVTLSERLEHIRQMKHESEREAIMEKLYEEVEKEMSDQDSQDSEGCSTDRGLDSGSQISRCMKKSKDPDEYRSHLTKSQTRMLEEHSSKQREKLIERVREKFQLKLEKNGLKTERNVIPLLKVRVVGFDEKNGVEVTKGYLSIWKPSAAVQELVTEGAWVEIINVMPTGVRNSEIQLSAGRQTVFNPYKQTNDRFNLYANTLKRKCYEIKEITQNPALTTDYNEIDTVGMIFCIEPSTKEFNDKHSFQNVYLADADKNIVCVNFWGGLKKFGYENILDTGQIITCVNLQKRAGNSRKSIPQYRVTEFSYFTKTPKDKKALEITNELSNKLSKIKDKFCQDCMLLKSNYSVSKTRNNENVSPYRFDYNVSKNMVSPFRNCDVNLNLTGLDFESSFDSQDISPQALLRKKKINEKIEKIRFVYGEPPPLASIHIINKSKNASSTYKSPLISNLERSKNYSSETPGMQNVVSPVTLNRTYVKNVNPVKLDFSNASNLTDSVDHFAEDFEASPPLSLDSDVVN